MHGGHDTVSKESSLGLDIARDKDPTLGARKKVGRDGRVMRNLLGNIKSLGTILKCPLAAIILSKDRVVRLFGSLKHHTNLIDSLPAIKTTTTFGRTCHPERKYLTTPKNLSTLSAALEALFPTA